MNQDIQSQTGLDRMDDPGPKVAPGGSRLIAAVLIVLILLAGAGLRFVYPEADPMPYFCMGTRAGDEGWQHEARNKFLWGEYHLPNDEWRTSLVTAPSNWLTYLSFRCFGLSTESLRLAPRLLGILTVVLMAITAWTAWGRTAGLSCMLTSTVALPLVAYSRVAMIEGFLLPASVLLLLLTVLQLKGRQLGFLIGLAAALCFAIKASAVLLILPMGFAMLVGVALERASSHSWLRSFQRMGIPGMLLGGLVGGAAYWYLVIRGNEEAWWFLNVKYHGVGRAAGMHLVNLVESWVKLPTHSEAILVVLAPLCLLAMYQGVQVLASLANWRKQISSNSNGRLVNPELFLTIVLLTAVLFLVVQNRQGVSGRRGSVLVPLVILVAHSIYAAGRGNPFRELSMRGRLLVFVVASPLLWVGMRSTYALITQGVRALISTHVWYEPLNVIKDPVRLAMDFGPFMVIAGLIVIVWLVRPVSLSPIVVRVCLATAILLQVVFFGDYARHRTYTVVTASRELGRLLPPGTVVLGNCADCLSWENRIKPIFTRYGITYANRDESKLARWNAPYVMVPSRSGDLRVGDTVEWSKMGVFCWKEAGASPLYSAYKRILAMFPIYLADVPDYVPDRNPGHCVLLGKQ